jgi:Flp pilus assembly protein TadG
MNRLNRKEKGNTIIEFTVAGIPLIFLLFTTLQLSIAVWNYFTLDHAVNVAARYAALHGATCSSGGNTCTVTLGQVATQLANAATGVPSGKINATFTTNSGAATPCNPLSSCLTSSTTWPPSSNNDNQVGANVTVKAQFQMSMALAMFWFRDGMTNDDGKFTFPATSIQQILY